MSRIKGKDTGIEVQVRKRLFKDGYRYRRNVKELPGKPDIVLPKYHVVIFVNGCYWHAHDCKEAHVPKSNTGFWAQKLARNIERDRKNYERLFVMGWKVIVVWECEIEGMFEETIKYIEESLFSSLISR